MIKKNYPLKGKKVWVAGHNGMVGSALIRRLERENCTLLTVSRKEADLRRQSELEEWMKANRPDCIFLAAATVGGIHANNTRPAEFIYDNMMIGANIIHAAYLNNVEKLVNLGSSCIYPKMAPQPMSEDALLTSPLEPTNEWYAVAKIGGIKLCAAYRRQYGCDFISAMPCNLYGINDNFTPMMSHVIPALIRRLHEAAHNNIPEVEIWGSGTPKREFLFSEDLADGLVYVMEHYSDEPHINVGTGSDLTIKELATLIGKTVGYQGQLSFDTSKPDGPPRKILDVGKLDDLGWKASTSLDDGLKKTYEWFLQQEDDALRGFS